MRVPLLFVTASLLALSARGADLLIVLNKSDNTASILDAKTGAARATVRVGKAPHEVEVLADGKTAAVSNYGTREDAGRTLTLIDIGRGTAIATVALPEGARPHGLKALSDGRLLVTAEGLKELFVVDPKARRVAMRIPTARETSHMVAASPDARRAYVANIGSGSVTVVDLAEGKVVSADRLFSTRFGKSPVPVGLLIAPDGKRAWVASTNADVVSAIDLEALTVVSRVTAGKEPDGLAGVFGP